ncbi:hypothetical protein D3C87_1811480 [compost metagenome]
MLEDDAQRHPGILAGRDNPFGRRRGAFHRLFHQHMLARPGRRGDDLLAGIGRGQHQDSLDCRIGQHGLVAGGGGKVVFGTELIEFGAVAPPDATHFDPVSQGIERLRVRLGCHAGAHHAQPECLLFSHHSAASF